MNREQIRSKAYYRMARIEELFADHVPQGFQQYWLLNFLIAEGHRSYITSYGLLPLHIGDCNDAREELGMGQLSAFERDCINFLNELIQQAEKQYERRRHLAVVSSTLEPQR